MQKIFLLLTMAITKLTKRELQIIKLLMDEIPNRDIAKRLYISERTVETHRKNIFRKTDSKTIVGLVKYILKNKLVNI